MTTRKPPSSTREQNTDTTIHATTQIHTYMQTPPYSIENKHNNKYMHDDHAKQNTSQHTIHATTIKHSRTIKASTYNCEKKNKIKITQDKHRHRQTAKTKKTKQKTPAHAHCCSCTDVNCCTFASVDLPGNSNPVRPMRSSSRRQHGHQIIDNPKHGESQQRQLHQIIEAINMTRRTNI